MYIFNSFHVVSWDRITLRWFFDKESIVSISGWMTLRLEKSVKVPEGTFDISIGFHFLEAHFQKDFFELFSNT